MSSPERDVAVHHVASPPVLAVDSYYATPQVQERIREYCGGARAVRPTAAYVVTLGTDAETRPTWDGATRIPSSELDTIWTSGADIARALWDARHLVFLIEIDYENADAQGEPFLHPADVFVKLEPAYQAALDVFEALRLPVAAIMTGRGYHFIGQIALDDASIEDLADLAPGLPAWYEGVSARRPAGVTADLSPRQAQAATGLGCLVEYVAHLIHRAAIASPIPVVFNGVTVGNAGPVGRECASIDFSYAGDPLDVRHVRTAFSTYQGHRLRPDIFGQAAAMVAPFVALPRGRHCLTSLLIHGRGFETGRHAAIGAHAHLPDLSAGIGATLAMYRSSRLGEFHRDYQAALGRTSTVRPVDPDTLPPCVATSLQYPNDLLLKPEHIQHVVRALMSRGWSPAEIARLVESRYESPQDWGDRWTTRMHTRTRAEFEVRVFAGLVVTGVDSLVDFNCVSAQEKGLCPQSGCRYDLRIDRNRLRRLTE
jgi:hypothetical protein